MMWNRKLATLLPLAALAVATNVRTQPPPQLVSSFAERSAKDQKRILERLETGVGALRNPYFDAVRVFADSGRKKGRARTKAMRKRTVKSRSRKSYRAVAGELAVTVRYRFGMGVVEPLHESRRDRARAAREVPVELAISGMLPGTDVALAEMLRRLDADDSADYFIAFLEAWRNGSETFYEALDRTAGTEDGVFFYDSMLGDFVQICAKTGQPGVKELRRGLDAAHGALHRSFLAYRQYRALREAVALTLLLPPDQPLPTRLARYEQTIAGGYSVRDQALMLLAVHDYDPAAVIDQLVGTAKPMPKPLWSQPYDSVTAFGDLYVAAMPQMIEQAGDTDRFLAIAIEQRQKWADQIERAALKTLSETVLR